ncbi:MAG: AraC family transcriptional regulator [Flavobacteriaceae bacterium]
MLLGDLEHLAIDKQSMAFPQHYHETYCISLIKTGIEQIQLEGKSIFSEKGTISITNPYEIHSNPLVNQEGPLDFDTIYIPEDVMRFFSNGKNNVILNRQITDGKVIALFNHLKDAMCTHDPKKIEDAVAPFIKSILDKGKTEGKDRLQIDFKDFDHINHYIKENITETFYLDTLSRMAHMNKYGFAKKFKAFTGMTPINYILMKKVFHSKTVITSDTELTQIAYDYGFSDLSHFSNTFKRFVGVSPKVYRNNLSH